MVHTLLPSVLQHLDSRGIEALILILKKILNCRMWPHHWSNTASQPSGFFLCWGTENSQIVPNQESMGGDQPVQSHIHSQQPLHAGALSWWNRTPFVSFPGHLRNVCSNYFSKSWITYPMWVYLEGNNAVNIRKDLIACIPSFIAVAQLLLSQPMNFSAHPRILRLCRNSLCQHLKTLFNIVEDP